MLARSDTTQGGPAAAGLAVPQSLALQDRLISAPPQLAAASGSFSSAPSPALPSAAAARSPSAPQPAPAGQPLLAGVPAMEFGFPKPGPAKSALVFARKPSGGKPAGGAAPAKRPVKLVPPIEASMGERQTSFARRAGGSGHGSARSDGGGQQAGHAAAGGGSANAMGGAASGELQGASPARKSFLVRQQLGLPAVDSPAARRALF